MVAQYFRTLAWRRLARRLPTSNSPTAETVSRRELSRGAGKVLPCVDKGPTWMYQLN